MLSICFLVLFQWKNAFVLMVLIVPIFKSKFGAGAASWVASSSFFLQWSGLTLFKGFPNIIINIVIYGLRPQLHYIPVCFLASWLSYWSAYHRVLLVLFNYRISNPNHSENQDAKMAIPVWKLLCTEKNFCAQFQWKQ